MQDVFTTPPEGEQSNIVDVPLSVYREHCYGAACHTSESVHAIREAGIKWDEAVAHTGCVMYLHAVPDGASFWPVERLRINGEWRFGNILELTDDSGNSYDHFEPADDAEPWFVIEALDRERKTIDLVGWPSARPGEFRTVEGIIGLGIEQVTNVATYFCDQPLYVHRTPLGWLQNGCRGCVVLDHEEAPAWLGWALGNICAEDIEHARGLARILHGYFDRKRILAPVRRAA